MRMGRFFSFLLVLAVSGLGLKAQESEKDITVDYNNPKEYVIGGISVEGNKYINSGQILNITGLEPGHRVTVPGEEVSAAVTRLWLQRFFEDVSMVIDSITPTRDTAYFKIRIVERPRVSRWTYSGVKSGEQKELQDKLNLKRGGEFSDYVAKTSTDIIKRFYKEKGFLQTDVKITTRRDSLVKNAIIVNFNVNRGPKVKIQTITFGDSLSVKESKLVRSMKKTKDKRLINFFSSKKFNEKEYENDKKNLISAFNEAGYRDARIVKDTIYYVEPGRLRIDFTIDEGKKYYFRNITWTGNSVYSADDLNSVLMIQKGDVYDVVTMEHRLFGGGKQNEYDVTKLYRDHGYLFFNLMPVELNIDGDSVDVEMRIIEGKPATLNNIIINGNDLTNERVIRR